MRYLIVSCSLRENSRSRVMAEAALADLKAAGAEVEWLDLLENPLPFCDGGAAYGDARVGPVAEKLRQADGILLAAPIYNYDLNAAAKNLVEMTGRDCWSGKVVGFLAAAGGSSSYMSVLSLANSLMVDFRSVIIPRFVYTDGAAFGPDGQLVDAGVRERIQRLASDLVGFSEGLSDVLRQERAE